MSNAKLETIKENITAQHGGDQKQLEVIFSDSPRLIVEAPAGYGEDNYDDKPNRLLVCRRENSKPETDPWTYF